MLHSIVTCLRFPITSNNVLPVCSRAANKKDIHAGHQREGARNESARHVDHPPPSPAPKVLVQTTAGHSHLSIHQNRERSPFSCRPGQTKWKKVQLVLTKLTVKQASLIKPTMLPRRKLLLQASTEPERSGTRI